MDNEPTMKTRAAAQSTPPDGQPTAPPSIQTETEPLADSSAATTPTATTAPPPAPQLAAPELPPPDPVFGPFWVAVRRTPRYLKLAASLARDPRVPRRAKAMLAVGVAYTVSPLDLVPGIIPVFGQLDDLLVILLSLRQAIRACPPALATEHLNQNGLTLADFDTDLAAARDVAVWLAKRGARATGRLARRTGRFLRATASKQARRYLN